MCHKSFKLFILVLCLSGVVSCSYKFVSDDQQLVGGYDLVSVPVFKNLTHETGIEVFFTNALINEIRRSDVARVTVPSAAQVVVEGTINSVKYTPGGQVIGVGNNSGSIRTLPAEAVLSIYYSIVLGVEIVIRRNSDRKVVWQGFFSGERSYLAPQIGSSVINSSNALYNQSAREQNIAVMAKDLMEQAYNRLTENF